MRQRRWVCRCPKCQWPLKKSWSPYCLTRLQEILSTPRLKFSMTCRWSENSPAASRTMVATSQFSPSSPTPQARLAPVSACALSSKSCAMSFRTASSCWLPWAHASRCKSLKTMALRFLKIRAAPLRPFTPWVGMAAPLSKAHDFPPQKLIPSHCLLPRRARRRPKHCWQKLAFKARLKLFAPTLMMRWLPHCRLEGRWS